MARLFISLSCLDSWIEQGQASLADDRLTTDGVVYHLQPAVHFAALAGPTADARGLLGRVKTKAQLQDLHAEHYQDSVIVGEAAYKVVDGFLGEPLG